MDVRHAAEKKKKREGGEKERKENHTNKKSYRGWGIVILDSEEAVQPLSGWHVTHNVTSCSRRHVNDKTCFCGNFFFLSISQP